MQLRSHHPCVCSIGCGKNPHNIAVAFAGIGSPTQLQQARHRQAQRRLDCLQHRLIQLHGQSWDLHQNRGGMQICAVMLAKLPTG